jgi:hypothetical protein
MDVGTEKVVAIGTVVACLRKAVFQLRTYFAPAKKSEANADVQVVAAFQTA